MATPAVPGPSSAPGGSGIPPPASGMLRQAVVALQRLPPLDGDAPSVPADKIDDTEESAGARPKSKGSGKARKRKATVDDGEGAEESAADQPASKKKKTRVRAKAPSGGPDHRTTVPIKKTKLGFQARGSGGRYGTLYPRAGIRNLSAALDLGMVRLPDEVVDLRELRQTRTAEGSSYSDPRCKLMYATLTQIVRADLSLHLPTAIPSECFRVFFFSFFFSGRPPRFWCVVVRSFSLFFVFFSSVRARCCCLCFSPSVHARCCGLRFSLSVHVRCCCLRFSLSVQARCCPLRFPRALFVPFLLFFRFVPVSAIFVSSRVLAVQPT